MADDAADLSTAITPLYNAELMSLLVKLYSNNSSMDKLAISNTLTIPARQIKYAGCFDIIQNDAASFLSQTLLGLPTYKNSSIHYHTTIKF